MLQEKQRRDDRDDDDKYKSESPKASNYSPALQSASVQPQHPPTQTSNSTGFVTKTKMCLSETAIIIFEMMQNNSFVKFFLPGALANEVEPHVLDKNSEKLSLMPPL